MCANQRPIVSSVPPIAGLTLAGADWTFDASDVAYQSLADGEDLPINVNYTVTDSQGATHQTSFDITVTGTNDAPVATFSTQQDVNEGTGMAPGQLTATDVDNGDEANLVFADTTGGIAGLTINGDGSFMFDFLVDRRVEKVEATVAIIQICNQ